MKLYLSYFRINPAKINYGDVLCRFTGYKNYFLSRLEQLVGAEREAFKDILGDIDKDYLRFDQILAFRVA